MDWVGQTLLESVSLCSLQRILSGGKADTVSLARRIFEQPYWDVISTPLNIPF